MVFPNQSTTDVGGKKAMDDGDLREIPPLAARDKYNISVR